MSRTPEQEAFSAAEGCLSPAEVAEYAVGALDEQRKTRAGAHLSGCARCQAELALFHQFQEAQVRPEEAPAVAAVEAELRRRWSAERSLEIRAPRRSWTARWLRPMAGVFAAVVIVVSASVYLRRPGAPPIDPSGVERGALRGGITLLSPAGISESVPGEFRWDAVEKAQSYRVHLFEVDRNELWTAEARGTSIALPERISRAIVPPVSLSWSVEALDSAGRVIVTSNLQTFHITGGRQ